MCARVRSHADCKKIMELGYMNPTAHMKSIGISTPDNRIHTDDYRWDTSTVVHILERLEYLGHTVNGRTYRKSYKNKKMLKRDRSEWQIFENTHEPIIDKETFDIVQRIRDGRRRNTPQGEMPAAFRHGLLCRLRSKNVPGSLQAFYA